MNPVVLFIPEAGIYSFARSLCVVGSAMQRLGHHVYITSCTGQMPRCPLKAMRMLPVDASIEETASACMQCQDRMREIQRVYNFTCIDMSKIVSSSDLEALNIYSHRSIAELEESTFCNFPVGKMAQYDLSLETKSIYTSQIGNQFKELYILYIKNTATSLLIASKIQSALNPDAFLTFNQYAQCEAAKFVAQQHGKKRAMITHPLHKGANYSLFAIETENYGVWFCHHRLQWAQFYDKPIPQNAVYECWEDVFSRLYIKNVHVYSPRSARNPHTLFSRLGLDPKRKTVVALPSCMEERASLASSVAVWNEDLNIQDLFPSQIAWLTELSEWAKTRPDVQLVIRIHPREGQTIRDNRASTHSALLRQAFATGHEHCCIVWPEDDVSSYDLAELADVACISWSGMGMELIRMGVPVLCCTGNFHYIDSPCIKVPQTVDAYFTVLDELLHAEVSFFQILMGIRYYYWRILVPYLNLEETVQASFDDDQHWPVAPESLLEPVCNAVMGLQRPVDFNIKNWLSIPPEERATGERVASIKSIKSFIYYSFVPFKKHFDVRKEPIHTQQLYKFKLHMHVVKSPLVHISDAPDEDAITIEYNKKTIDHYIQSTEKNRYSKVFLSDGLNNIFISNGEIFYHASKMLFRLAKAVADTTQGDA